VSALKTRRTARLRVFPLAALLVLAALTVSACGASEKRSSGVEGDFIHVGDAVYQVQLTRPLNPLVQPDKVLLHGQVPASRDEEFLAVFLKISNDGKSAYAPPRDMKVVDTIGNEYLPLDASQTGFGLDFNQQISPGGEAPEPESPGAEGPDRGAMVLFRLKVQSITDNLPLTLEVPTGGKSPAQIRLDV
jgi:hypothetical protein